MYIQCVTKRSYLFITLGGELVPNQEVGQLPVVVIYPLKKHSVTKKILAMKTDLKNSMYDVQRV